MSSKFREGFNDIIQSARSIDIHWTEDERNETLKAIVTNQKHIEREDGHNYSSPPGVGHATA